MCYEAPDEDENAILSRHCEEANRFFGWTSGNLYLDNVSNKYHSKGIQRINEFFLLLRGQDLICFSDCGVSMSSLFIIDLMQLSQAPDEMKTRFDMPCHAAT
jgi:hypothetical protein